MTNVFSDYTLQVLREAGWYLGRTIDISEYETILTNIGYSLNNTIRAFFIEFGGLKLRTSHTFWDDCPPTTCKYLYVFDPLPNADRTFAWLEEYETLIHGEKLVVIGDQHDMTFLMSHSGKVYGCLDHYFCLLADNLYEAIEEFCMRKKIPIVLNE